MLGTTNFVNWVKFICIQAQRVEASSSSQIKHLSKELEAGTSKGSTGQTIIWEEPHCQKQVSLSAGVSNGNRTD